MEQGMRNRIAECPGLHGIICGLEKVTGQGYCQEHGRQYQRERYHNRKKDAERGTLTTRPYYRSGQDDEQDRCPACNYLKPGSLVTLTSFSKVPPICSVCIETLNKLRSTIQPGNLVAIVDFLHEHRDVIIQDDAGDRAFNEEVTRRLRVKKIDENWDTYEDVEEMFAGEIIHELNEDIRCGRWYYNPETRSIVKKSAAQLRKESDETSERRRQERIAKETPEERKEREKREREAAEVVQMFKEQREADEARLGIEQINRAD